MKFNTAYKYISYRRYQKDIKLFFLNVDFEKLWSSLKNDMTDSDIFKMVNWGMEQRGAGRE